MASLPCWLKCVPDPENANSVLVAPRWWAAIALRVWFWFMGCSWGGDVGVDGAMQCERCGREINVPSPYSEAQVLALIEAHDRFFHKD
jgi:hypothetical protein